MFDINKILVPENKQISLTNYSPKYVGESTKISAKKELKKNKKELKKVQEIFWADDKYSLLIILQAPDAAGKDGAIRHVMSGVNPQGCKVSSFKSPSKIELDHNYLWRHYLALPERGQIGIFNRSHYENVLITKVHPEFVLNEKLPEIKSLDQINDTFWQHRYSQINNFEEGLYQNGTIILKFFLNLSKAEQKQRFLDRLNEPNKNWKFSSADLKERAFWDKYQQAYEDMINNTSKKHAPWHIIPADNKWFSRMAIGKIIINTLKNLDLKFPAPENPERLQDAKIKLENEQD